MVTPKAARRTITGKQTLFLTGALQILDKNVYYLRFLSTNRQTNKVQGTDNTQGQEENYKMIPCGHKS